MINGMFEDMPSDGRVVNMSAIVNNLLFELALRQVLYAFTTLISFCQTCPLKHFLDHMDCVAT